MAAMVDLLGDAFYKIEIPTNSSHLWRGEETHHARKHTIGPEHCTKMSNAVIFRNPCDERYDQDMYERRTSDQMSLPVGARKGRLWRAC